MTIQEKAEELVDKYWLKEITNDREIAKQCALIAVNEILNTVNNLFNTYSQNDYWLQVKQEIEKI